MWRARNPKPSAARDCDLDVYREPGTTVSATLLSVPLATIIIIIIIIYLPKESSNKE